MWKLINSFCSRNLNGKPFARPWHIWVKNIKTDIQEREWQSWIGLTWLRKGTCGRLLHTWLKFWFDKMWNICWLAK
jgi:hypothetical protein